MKMGLLSVSSLLQKWRLRTKWLKMAFCPYDFRRFGPGFTDKGSEKSLLSVNFHHNGQRFTDKLLENAGLSVNLHEVLTRLVEQNCI
ncbi:hypothetical protein LRP_1165 [Ligilactobacillus ruminis]|nr:hypothetical protein LRP_1165 [Ligilactobacillus ruminis]